ncbi:MAG: anaerobic ribonucleoside-triphosphate reductase, partial [Lachnospiraceae bacterium]|nr:anaerobic ribonucleoside-triphosphate reductase [Lachnospiraceae bacterium]
MNIIKRNGKEVVYDAEKIIGAVKKANNEVRDKDRLLESQINVVEEKVRLRLNELDHEAGVEEIQDYVIEAIQSEGAFKVATKYTVYRYQRELVRKSNTTDDKILTLVEYDNEEVKEENSNKNPMVVSVQRDYMAGEVSRDLTDRVLLPKDITEAHRAGIIHFHDSDYFVQHMYNCCLVNL